MKPSTALATLIVLAPLFHAALAHADSAAAATYRAQVTGNQVIVCPENYGSNCPAAGGMLRVDVADGGGVAKLPDFCEAPPSDFVDTSITSCYVDECVPPGTYQYGFTTPIECSATSDGELAIVVTVTDALSDCVSDAGALTDAGSAPWDPGAATGGSVPNTSCHEAGQDAGHVPIADAGADAGESDAGTPTKTDDSSGATGSSCAVALLGGAQNKVVAIDGLALAFGFAALGRRRSKKRA